MSKNWLTWGRIIYSIPLSITGVIYITKPQGTVESLTSFIPGDLGLIYVAGVLWVILGMMIACNIKTRYATWGVIGLLSLYHIIVHMPAVYSGEHLNIVWFELLRNLSLMGGAFFIMAAETNKTSESYADLEHEDMSLTMH